jgi:DNA-binding MurR/RpiR family transcriptional regulator
MTIAEHIVDRRDDLTPAERKVAEFVLRDPHAAAFGNVAVLAERTGTSGATVVRTATKLGFDGFIGLQGAVQAEISAQLRRPATEKIRQPIDADVIEQVLAAERQNLEATLSGLDRADFATAVEWLADTGRRLLLCAGDCARGVALLAGDQMLSVRPDITVIDGNQVQVGRELALVRPGDVVVVIDFRRYDHWVLQAARIASERGAKVIALTDSRLGPLGRTADATFVVSAVGVGPFDSQVATLAMLNALVVGVASESRSEAAARLDDVEAVWQQMGALAEPE